MITLKNYYVKYNKNNKNTKIMTKIITKIVTFKPKISTKSKKDTKMVTSKTD
jgi:hypothetical protein